jgi:hypothetical protein
MNEVKVQKSILFLAANPRKTTSLRLQEEEREIKECLRQAGYGKVPIYSTGATRTRDIPQAMLDFKPQIVHFSGHGAGEEGLVFEDVTGQAKLVDSETLADLFRLFSSHVECVVLNACYSKFQAEAIARHINYVVGMEQAIGDRAAVEFAVGFYTAVGAGESFEFGYQLGCNAIRREGIPEHLTPTLFNKKALGKSISIGNVQGVPTIVFFVVYTEVGAEYQVTAPRNMRTQTLIENILAVLKEEVAESLFIKNAEMYNWSLFLRENLLTAIPSNSPLQAACIKDGTICEIHPEIKESFSTIRAPSPSSTVHNVPSLNGSDVDQVELRQQFYEEYIQRKQQKED